MYKRKARWCVAGVAVYVWSDNQVSRQAAMRRAQNGLVSHVIYNLLESGQSVFFAWHAGRPIFTKRYT